MVPWSIPGGDVELEDRIDACSSAIFLVGLIATGLTALIAAVAIRCASKSPMASRPGHQRPTSSVSEKLSITEPQALTHEQRLYQHFPGHQPTMDDGLHQADGSNSYLKKEDASNMSLQHASFANPDLSSSPHQSGSTDSHSPAQRLTRAAAPRFMMPRPPPPPPLTPPELSSSIFNVNHRKFSYTATSPEMGAFFDQPNPDYSSDSVVSQTTATAPALSLSPSTPRRRSYTKSVPIGVPALTPSVSLTSEGSDLLSSSFPPTIPFLPGPPPSHDMEFTDSPYEMDVQGEIISVLDDAGAGWKRHTRVYGGGVCLACAASGGEGHGGFYGVNVRPEDRR